MKIVVKNFEQEKAGEAGFFSDADSRIPEELITALQNEESDSEESESDIESTTAESVVEKAKERGDWNVSSFLRVGGKGDKVIWEHPDKNKYDDAVKCIIDNELEAHYEFYKLTSGLVEIKVVCYTPPSNRLDDEYSSNQCIHEFEDGKVLKIMNCKIAGYCDWEWEELSSEDRKSYFEKANGGM